MLIDFRLSNIEWCTKEDSTGIFNLDSVLKINEKHWALGSEVKACNVYDKNSLFKVPSYSFQPLFSAEECRIYRTFQQEKTDDTHSGQNEIFKYHKLNLFYKKEMKKCDPNELIHCAAQCHIQTKEQEIQFPIKHLNKNKKGEFQIETGPIAFHLEGDLTLAYIAFNELNSFELLIINNSLNKREQKIIKNRNCEINLYTEI